LEEEIDSTLGTVKSPLYIEVEGCRAIVMGLSKWAKDPFGWSRTNTTITGRFRFRFLLVVTSVSLKGNFDFKIDIYIWFDIVGTYAYAISFNLVSFGSKLSSATFSTISLYVY